MRPFTNAVSVLTILALLGCERDKQPSEADTSGAATLEDWTDTLAFTEFMDESGYSGEWFELHNTSGRDLDLDGLVVRNGEGTAWDLDVSFTFEADDYVVFGQDGMDNEDELDASYRAELLGASPGALWIEADGEILDSIIWGSNSGTLGESSLFASLTVDPDYASADDNSSASVWCSAPEAYDTSGGQARYGSPGERNAYCPQFDHDGDGYPGEDDCDDTNAAVSPDQEEVWYDGVDADCDGVDDYDQDDDGDRAQGYEGGADCDDTDDQVSSETDEICDGIDNDCDGDVDIDDSSLRDGDTWYADADDDGYGDPDAAVEACEAPEGYVTNARDCDDSDPTIHRSADETWYDGVDSDCDGDSDYDQDGDGEDAVEYGGTDCDDTDRTSAGQVGYFPDADADGYGEPTTALLSCTAITGYVTDYTDCDDSDATVHPGAAETWYDGLDGDCLGDSDYDADADGYDLGETFFDDCDDTEPRTYPGAVDYIGLEGVPCFQSMLLIDVMGSTSEILDSGLGESLAGASDLDGDGVGDLVFGLSNADSTEATEAGYAEIILGRTDGAVHFDEVVATLNGANTRDKAGETVAGLDDTDGDGYGVLAVGASGLDDAATEAGGVYLLHGPLSGDLSLSSADAVLLGVTTRDTAGRALAALPDWDEDGAPALVIGAPNEDTGGKQAGAAYVTDGAETGGVSLASASLMLLGEATADRAASALSSAGDTDGDGLGDLLVASSSAKVGSTSGYGVAWLVLGPESGTVDLADAAARIEGSTSIDALGASLAPLGDLDGDGYADFAVGATGLTDGGTLTDAGGAYLFLGPVVGTLEASSTADASITGDIDGALAGAALASPGDLDEDGAPDLAVGAPEDSSLGRTEAGAIYVFTGLSAGTRLLSSAAEIKYGTDPDEHAGQTLAAPGDVTGDGDGDLLIGTPGRRAAGGVWLVGEP